MTVLEQFDKEVTDLRGKFISDWYDKNYDPVKMGNLLFKYHDTYGLTAKAANDVLEECIRQDLEREWKGIVKGGLEHCKKLEEER